MSSKIKLIAGALIVLAVGFLMFLLPKKENKPSREEILEKAREAKKFKSQVKDLEIDQEPQTKDENEN